MYVKKGWYFMAITTRDKVFEVEDSEFGYAEKQLPVAGTDTIELFVPKIMGNLSGTGPDSNSADGIFDNDPACKPSFAKKVNRVKVINVPLEKNGLWLAHLTSEARIPKGAKFRVHFINKNIHNPYATTS